MRILQVLLFNLDGAPYDDVVPRGLFALIKDAGVGPVDDHVQPYFKQFLMVLWEISLAMVVVF